MSLRVMSYNIKGHGSLFNRDHVQEIARVIREAEPDVAGLQEVHRGTWQVRYRDQAAELERLTGMKLFFGRSMGDQKSEYGNAILTRGEIIEAHAEALPGTGEPRTLLVSTIAVNGTKLHAYVTHFSAWGRFGSRNRFLQAEAVAALTSRSTLPFILTGDFNTNPTSDELRLFHKGDIVSSCFVESVVTHRTTRQCLDYIFADRGWEVRAARVLTHGPSDHWPLIAELERSGGG